MKRAAIAALVLLLLGAAGAAAWIYLRNNTDDGRLVLQGNVDVRTLNLAFEIGGRIVRMGAQEGDAVEAGAAVAALETTMLEDEVRRARAEAAVARANLAALEAGTRPEEIAQARAEVAERVAAVENARDAFARQETLLQRGIASQQAYDEARAAQRRASAALESAEAALALAEAGPRKEDIAAAEARLEGAMATLGLAEERLADAVLTAPEGGIILTRIREPGAIVAPGEPVYTMALIDPVWVRTYVAEPSLGRVRPGLPATVSTDGGEVYRGHVGFISPVAEFTPRSVQTPELRTDLVYRLRVIVDNPDARLRQGMPVTVTLQPAMPEG